MWIKKAPYPLRADLPVITRHDQLPHDCIHLADVRDATADRHLYFVLNNGYLSILDVVDRQRQDGTGLYNCGQDDFPLELVLWFPIALEEFKKPPAEGGLHAGGMTTPDIRVGGEMLCLQRALGIDHDRGGYTVMNRSRCARGYNPDEFYKPHSVSWASRLLYDGGLLELIKDLGKRYQAGQL